MGAEDHDKEARRYVAEMDSVYMEAERCHKHHKGENALVSSIHRTTERSFCGFNFSGRILFDGGEVRNPGQRCFH